MHGSHTGYAHCVVMYLFSMDAHGTIYSIPHCTVHGNLNGDLLSEHELRVSQAMLTTIGVETNSVRDISLTLVHELGTFEN